MSGFDKKSGIRFQLHLENGIFDGQQHGIFTTIKDKYYLEVKVYYREGDLRSATFSSTQHENQKTTYQANKDGFLIFPIKSSFSPATMEEKAFYKFIHVINKWTNRFEDVKKYRT